MQHCHRSITVTPILPSMEHGTDGTLSLCHSLASMLQDCPWIQAWMQMPYLQALGIAVGGWACLLAAIWCLPVSWEFKQQGADRVMAVIHALLVALQGGVVELCTDPKCTVGHSWVKMPVIILLGYLLVDFFSMLMCDVIAGWRSPDISMMTHHIFIFCMFTVGYANDIALWFASTLMINEASTPFMTAMWYLTYSGRKSSNIFVINGIVFVLMFFLSRIVFIPFSFYQCTTVDLCSRGTSADTFVQRNAPRILFIGYILIFLLNAMWFKKLVHGAMKKLGMVSSTEKGEADGAGVGKVEPGEARRHLLSNDMQQQIREPQ